jgi:hypothetical protein
LPLDPDPGSGFQIRIRIRLHKVTESGSNPDPDPQPCLKAMEHVLVELLLRLLISQLRVVLRSRIILIRLRIRDGKWMRLRPVLCLLIKNVKKLCIMMWLWLKNGKWCGSYHEALVPQHWLTVYHGTRIKFPNTLRSPMIFDILWAWNHSHQHVVGSHRKFKITIF